MITMTVAPMLGSLSSDCVVPTAAIEQAKNHAQAVSASVLLLPEGAHRILCFH